MYLSSEGVYPFLSSPSPPPPPLPLFQDLIPVKFTPVADGDSKAAAIVKEARYMCPVTRDTLSNSVPSLLLRPRYTSYTLKTQVEIIQYRDRILKFFFDVICFRVHMQCVYTCSLPLSLPLLPSLSLSLPRSPSLSLPLLSPSVGMW